MSKYVPPFMKGITQSAPALESSTPLSKGTLSALTSNKGKPVMMTEDDFPALGKKPVVTNVVNTTHSYANLAKDWAKKKQEDEEKTKQMAESEAIQAKLGFDDRITRELSAKLKAVRLQCSRAVDAEEEQDILPPIDDYEVYNTFSAEIEEEEEYDPTVNYKRNRNELSTF